MTDALQALTGQEEQADVLAALLGLHAYTQRFLTCAEGGGVDAASELGLAAVLGVAALQRALLETLEQATVERLREAERLEFESEVASSMIEAVSRIELR